MRKSKSILTESFELDEKQTPSDKIFHIVGLWSGSIAGGLLIFNLIIFFAVQSIAVAVWLLIFYPICIFVIAGTFCSGAQLLRNPYFSSILAFCINIAAGIALITVLIVQGVVYKEIFIMPFVWL